MLQDDINRQREVLRQLEAQQAACSHVFGDPFYDPYDGKEEYLTGEYETHGVHHWPKTAFRDVKKPRWTKICDKCGFRAHTEKLKEVRVETAPDFGRF